MPEQHHTSRRAQGLKKGAARQQKRRDKLKKEGVPTTHVVNRAVAEGLLYYLDAERAKGVSVNDAVISVKDVLVYATRVLSRQTNATDHYNPQAIHKVLRGRIGKVSPVKFRIAPTWPGHVDNDGA